MIATQGPFTYWLYFLNFLFVTLYKIKLFGEMNQKKMSYYKVLRT